ncbi:MAG: hypothetical protein ACJ798_20200 [Phenylobacterium sp.]
MGVVYGLDSLKISSGGRELVLARVGRLNTMDIPYSQGWGAWTQIRDLQLDPKSKEALRAFWQRMRGSQPRAALSDVEVRSEVAAAVRRGQLSCILTSASKPMAPPPLPVRKIAWGAKVSSAFKAKVIDIADRLGIDPDWLMAIMNFESGGTFKSDTQNRGGSHFYGLIQAGVPVITRTFGLTVQKFRALDPVDQLDYVEQYFHPYAGKMHSLSDAYMVVLWPAAVGKADTFVLFQDPTKAYSQNSGLDADKDKKVTKAEAAAAVLKSLNLGRNVKNEG